MIGIGIGHCTPAFGGHFGTSLASWWIGGAYWSLGSAYWAVR